MIPQFSNDRKKQRFNPVIQRGLDIRLRVAIWVELLRISEELGMLEESQFAINELHEQWQEDPSQVLVEDAIDRMLFELKALSQMMIAYERRFEMMEKRFNEQEKRIADVTVEVARWRGEIRAMRR